MPDLNHDDVDSLSSIVLAMLNADEVSRVLIVPQIETQELSGSPTALAFVKCTTNGDVRSFELSSVGLLEALQIVSTVETDGDDQLDKTKSIEQIIRTTYSTLKEVEANGAAVPVEVSVWHLQPYCRDWDINPPPQP